MPVGAVTAGEAEGVAPVGARLPYGAGADPIVGGEATE